MALWTAPRAARGTWFARLAVAVAPPSSDKGAGTVSSLLSSQERSGKRRRELPRRGAVQGGAAVEVPGRDLAAVTEQVAAHGVVAGPVAVSAEERRDDVRMDVAQQCFAARLFVAANNLHLGRGSAVM